MKQIKIFIIILFVSCQSKESNYDIFDRWEPMNWYVPEAEETIIFSKDSLTMTYLGDNIDTSASTKYSRVINDSLFEIIIPWEPEPGEFDTMRVAYYLKNKDTLICIVNDNDLPLYYKRKR